MIGRRLLQIFILSLTAIVFFGCSSSSNTPAKKKDNIAIIPIEGDPQTLDPRKMRDLGSINVAHMFYEGLTRVNPQGHVELALAKSIEPSSDGLTYTVVLRDARWSDGSPLTADDFVATWKSTLHPEFSAPNAYQLYVIEGAKEAKEGKASVDQVGVIAKDAKTLVIKVKEPTPYLLELLSCQFAYPVHIALREGRESALPISNGPFTLADARDRQSYTFAKNKEYWDADNVHLDGVVMKVLSESTALHMFKAGQLDWAGSPQSTLPQDAVLPLKEAKKLLVAPAAATHWFRFNTKKGPLASQKLRKALTLAVDRQGLVDNVTQGNQYPALTVVPPVMGLHSRSDLKDNDVVRAKLLLAEAQKEDAVANPLTLTLSYVANDRGHKIAQAMQQQWQNALGIQVNLEASEQKALLEKMRKGDYEISYGSWYADNTDPVNFLEIFQYASNPTNQTFWENREYSALLDAAAKETTPEKRLSLLTQAEEILLRELPVSPLMYPTYNYLKSDRLQGVYFSPLGYLDYRQAQFVGKE